MFKMLKLLVCGIEKEKNESGFMPLFDNKLTSQEIELIKNWKENGAPNN